MDEVEVPILPKKGYFYVTVSFKKEEVEKMDRFIASFPSFSFRTRHKLVVKALNDLYSKNNFEVVTL